MPVVEKLPHFGWQIRMNISAIEGMQDWDFYGRLRGWFLPRQPRYGARDSLKFLKATWHSTDSPECCGKSGRTFLGRPLAVSLLRFVPSKPHRPYYLLVPSFSRRLRWVFRPWVLRPWASSKTLELLRVQERPRDLQSQR